VFRNVIRVLNLVFARAWELWHSSTIRDCP